MEPDFFATLVIASHIISNILDLVQKSFKRVAESFDCARKQQQSFEMLPLYY